MNAACPQDEIEFQTKSVEGLSEPLFEDPTEDYLSVADTLGVNRSAARSFVATYLREGRVNERPCGGRNNVRVDNEMRDCINEILNENCLLHCNR